MFEELEKELEKEVGLMNESFEADISTEAPGTESPGTAVPGTDAPGTESPGTETPSTEAPSTESPGTEAPTTEVPAEDERDVTIRELREKLALKEEGPKTSAPSTSAPTTEVPLTFEEQDFLKDLDLDDLTSDPKEFNKLLNALYQKAVTDTQRGLGEGVLRSIPDIVRANVTAINTLKEASDEFYADNKDLKPFKKVVAAVFEEFASDNPEKKYSEILADVGPEVRTRLELHRKATNKKKEAPPNLHRRKGKSGGPREEPETTPLVDELDEMNKTLGR